MERGEVRGKKERDREERNFASRASELLGF